MCTVIVYASVQLVQSWGRECERKSNMVRAEVKACDLDPARVSLVRSHLRDVEGLDITKGGTVKIAHHQREHFGLYIQH